ncbi:hypothetical protein ABG768_022372 [Culter alburnus]|uniref:Uncharacterized protein n=1 Tax=Culter alburnus TaxID=194366 RepID=A0AAW2AKP1_CULAL
MPTGTPQGLFMPTYYPQCTILPPGSCIPAGPTYYTQVGICFPQEAPMPTGPLQGHLVPTYYPWETIYYLKEVPVPVETLTRTLQAVSVPTEIPQGAHVFECSSQEAPIPECSSQGAPVPECSSQKASGSLQGVCVPAKTPQGALLAGTPQRVFVPTKIPQGAHVSECSSQGKPIPECSLLEAPMPKCSSQGATVPEYSSQKTPASLQGLYVPAKKPQGVLLARTLQGVSMPTEIPQGAHMSECSSQGSPI